MNETLISAALSAIRPFANTDAELRLLQMLETKMEENKTPQARNPLDDTNYRDAFRAIASASPSNVALLLRVALLHHWLRSSYSDRSDGLYAAACEPFSINWRAEDGYLVSPEAKQLITTFCANGAGGHWTFLESRNTLQRETILYYLPIDEIGVGWRKKDGDTFPKLYPTRTNVS